MKLLRYSSLIILLCYLSSCDKIDSPNMGGGGVIVTGVNPLEEDSVPQDMMFLIEDFTGHKCSNCPAAAVIADDLHEQYPDIVQVVSVHSPDGAFQEVSSTHPTEFKTEAGTEYATEIQVFPGNPSGLMNRNSDANFIAGGHFALSADWNTYVQDWVAMELPASISLAHEIETSATGDSLFLTVHGKFFSDVSADLTVINYLIRKSVISPQTISDGTVVNDYNHHNVLSDNIGGTWGTQVDSDLESEVGDLFSFGYSYDLNQWSSDPTFEISNLAIVSFVCDRDDYLILQSIFTPLQ